MTSMNRTLAMLAVLVSMAGAGFAQQAPRAGGTAANAVQPANAFESLISPTVLLTQGHQAVRAVDEGQYQGLWSSASPAVKALVPGDEFTKGVAGLRGGLGAPVRRIWVALTVQSGGQEGRLAPALYASAEFETTFSAANATVRREVVSFRLDEDQQWRFAGYSLR